MTERKRTNSISRYADEASFFDRQARRRLSDNNSFKFKNDKTHVQLFNQIYYLKPVVNFFGDIYKKRLLDLACGDGWASIYFARSGAEVYCCDISPKCIELAQTYAEANGLAERIRAFVMPAEHLSFEDDFFDYVFLKAGLHHCDVVKATTQIKRVLKPRGRAAMIEDYAYHPLFRIYRRLNKSRHTRYEKPLSEETLYKIRCLFKKIEVRYFGLLQIYNYCNSFGISLEWIDQKLFMRFKSLQRYARIISVFVEK